MATVAFLAGAGAFNTTAGSKTGSATPTVGDLLVIIAGHTGNTASVAPTDDNPDGLGTYSLVNTAVKNSSADTMTVWVRSGLVGSATLTNFTHNPGTTTGGGFGVMAITGMSRSGSSAILQSAIQSNQAASGTPTPVFGATTLSANAILGAVFNATNPATMTPPATWTEAVDVGYNTPVTGIELAYDSSGSTLTSVAWGSTSASAFASVVVELDTSSAAVSASSATTDGADVLAGTAEATVDASEASTDGADVLAAAVGPVVDASSATTDGADVLAASVTLVSSSVDASAALVEGADVAAAAVSVVNAASSATTDGADVAAGQVSVINAASSATVDGADVLAAAVDTAIFAASAALVENADTLTANVENGSAGGGGYGETRKRRYVQRIGGQLVVFTDPNMALEAIQPEPEKTVEIQAIKKVAKVFKQEKKVMTLFKSKDYEQVLTAYESMLQQDEEDVEMLLLTL